MVERFKDGRSYAALADASGGAISRQRWQQLAQNDVKVFPEPDTIRVMARVLHVNEAAVVAASAETLGLAGAPESDSRLARLFAVMPDLDLLNDEQTDSLVTLVRQAVVSLVGVATITATATAYDATVKVEELTNLSERRARKRPVQPEGYVASKGQRKRPQGRATEDDIDKNAERARAESDRIKRGGSEGEPGRT